MALDVTATAAGAAFRVKVQTGAGRTAAAGEWAGALKLKVGKPPERGAANQECLEFLARRLGVPRRALSIMRGEHAHVKVIQVAGAQPAQVLARLQEWSGNSTHGGCS